MKRLALSSSAIKYLGVILMVFDHIHEFFPETPVFFCWLGRPVAAMFLFVSAEAYHYTRNRETYLIRLFIAWGWMTAATMVLTGIYPEAPVPLVNNIFGTLLLAAVFMRIARMFSEGICLGRPSRVFAAIGIALLIVITGLGWVTFVYIYVFTHSLSEAVALAIYRLVPNLLYTEGGPVFVALGAAFYALRRWREAQILALGGAALYFTLAGYPYQWMMLAAAVPIALYSGERGNAPKWFFYAFYPAHIITLFLMRAVG